MTRDEFRQLFETATRGYEPFPFQERMALDGTRMPSLVHIPTGCGKTEGIVLGWLWRRRFAAPEIREATPRRLVYCLPMRVLVEQTRGRVRAILGNLGMLADVPGDDRPTDPLKPFELPGPRIAVSTLMGGEDEDDWDHWPERDTILIGTQDMLLSRALNRGYAMSRFRWPVHFGLLNNDCLWVFDEVQLMGNGLATSTQLQALRRLLGTASGVQTTWMSATLHQDWLRTVDFDPALDSPGPPVVLEEADQQNADVRKRLLAKKAISPSGFEPDEKGGHEAALVANLHRPHTLTLVVVNTVKRAMTIFETLSKRKPAARLVLLHSRFRPQDRANQLVQLLESPPPEGIIAVCTQVIEAGVDVSASLLVTDTAPWSSMVQRFGRCNRRGEQEAAQIIWIPVDEKNTAPYDPEALRVSQERLERLSDAGPASLPSCLDDIEFRHVLRRKDIVDLFDTTPDLSGFDLDVSRFIREVKKDEAHDVHVFWRDVPPNQDPSSSEPLPAHSELCAIPVSEIQQFKADKWCWDHLERKWVVPGSLFPGMRLMLRSVDGGYDPALGWTGKSGRTEPCPVTRTNLPSIEPVGTWQSLAQHTDRVVQVLDALIAALPAVMPWSQELRIAARWHDAGKAHPVFQEALADKPDPTVVWAKRPDRGPLVYSRKGFRHELASALAMLQNGFPDLAVYLAAAHHGKVRLSIRSLPHEQVPDDAHRRFARGVWEDDELPPLILANGVTVPQSRLSLSYMEVGEDPASGSRSWLDRMIRLRDDPGLGPFRMAFLEAVLRVADWRASNESVPRTDDRDEG